MALHEPRIRRRLDELVTAMKACGSWDIPHPGEPALVDMGAFGAQTMAFDQWLRWVFVPRVEETLASHGPWPAESNVAARAYREWDGAGDRDAVLHALHRFDELFGK